MAQHTEGEWKACCDSIMKSPTIRIATLYEDRYIPINSKPQHLVATIELKGKDYVEAEANAHLIAAAPDMYEALKELSQYIKYNMGNARPIYEKTLEALAKAEGRK